MPRFSMPLGADPPGGGFRQMARLRAVRRLSLPVAMDLHAIGRVGGRGAQLQQKRAQHRAAGAPVAADLRDGSLRTEQVGAVDDEAARPLERLVGEEKASGLAGLGLERGVRGGRLGGMDNAVMDGSPDGIRARFGPAPEAGRKREARPDRTGLPITYGVP
jgi:hypothetical protein